MKAIVKIKIALLIFVLFIARSIASVDQQGAYYQCIHANDVNSSLYSGGPVSFLKCEKLCYITKGECACTQYSSDISSGWNLVNPLQFLDIKCFDMSCLFDESDGAYGTVTFESYDLGCENVQSKIAWFNATNHAENRAYGNFMNINPPSSIVYANQQVRLTFLLIGSATFSNPSYTVLLGDGNTKTLYEEEIDHIYTLPGVYTIQASPDISSWIYIEINHQLTVLTPFSNIVLESCSHRIYFISDMQELFTCVGYLEKGKNVMMYWDFKEQVIVPLNITGSDATPLYFGAPCFVTCGYYDKEDEIGWYYEDYVLAGIFLMKHSSIPYDGRLTSLEVYAEQSSAKIYIYRKVGDQQYSMIAKQELSLEDEYNIFELTDDFNVKQGDYLAFGLESETKIQLLYHSDGGTLEFYAISDVNSLSTVKNEFSSRTFNIRVCLYPTVYFIMEYNLTMTGYHNIDFRAVDTFENELTSNAYQVAVKSYRPEIFLKNNPEKVVVNEYFSICVTIKNGGLTTIIWNTTHSGVTHLHNDTESQLGNEIITHQEKSSIAIEIEECIKLKVTDESTYSFTIAVFIKDEELAAKSISVTGYPQVTGFELTPVSIPQPLYQIAPITLQGACGPYPYNHSIVWDFGDSFTQVHNPGDSFTKVYFYKQKGNYTISLNIYYFGFVKSVYLNITVLETFAISGVPIAITNQEITLNLTSLLPYNALWVYYWNLDDDSAIIQNEGKSDIKKAFPLAGRYNIECIVKTVTGVNISNYFEIFILEPINNLQVELKAGEKNFLKTYFTIEATHSSGNELNFLWSSNGLEIISVNQSEVVVHTEVIGTFTVDLIVSNLLFNASATKTLLVLDAMQYFGASLSNNVLQTGGATTLNISTIGGSNKSFKLSFSDNNSTETTNLSLITRRFNHFGKHEINILALMNGNIENCYEFSLVPCNITIPLDVLNPITGLIVSYYDNNNQEFIIDDVIYHSSNTELTLKLLSINGTDVKFLLTLDEETMHSFNTSFIGLDTVVKVPLSKVNFVTLGLYICNVSVFNGINKVSQSFSIYVEHLIENISITFDPIIDSEVKPTYNISAAAGSNINYLWQFTDKFTSTLSSFQKDNILFGNQNFTVSVFNNISRFVFTKTFKIVSAIEGIKVICGKSELKVQEEVTMYIGFIKGSLVTIHLDYSNSQQFTSFGPFNGPHNQSYPLSFIAAGFVVQTITMINTAEEKTILKCFYSVQDVIYSAYMRVYPVGTAYIDDSVSVSVGIFGGTNATGVLQIFTQNNLLVASETVKFKGVTGSIYHYVDIDYKFETADAYVLSMDISNLVSKVNVSGGSIFVIDNTRDNTGQASLDLIAESAVLGKPTTIHLITSRGFKFFYCDLSYGDTTPSVRIDQSVISPITYTYDEVGEYNLKLVCLSSIGDVTVETTAHVQMEIEINEIFAPSQCIVYGNSFNLSFLLKDVLMSKHLIKKISLNDTEINDKALYNNDTQIIYHISVNDYRYSGTTSVSVVLRNFVSQVDIEKSICIQKVIEQVSCQTPVVWRYGPITPFQITVRSETPVDLLVSFGDSSTDLTIAKYSSATLQHEHQYYTTGMFHYYIRAINDVSTTYFNESIEVIQKIEKVSVIHKHLVDWPINNIEFAVHFQDNISNTAVIKYQLYFGDDHITELRALNLNNIQNGTVFLANHVYEAAGCYAITISLQGKINTIVLQSDLIISNINSMDALLTSEFDHTNGSDNFLVQVFRADYPLSLQITNAESSCFSYTLILYNANQTELYNETSTTTSFSIDSLIDQPGVYNIYVYATIKSLLYPLLNRTFGLIKGLPPLAILTLSSPHEVKKMLVLTNAYPPASNVIHINYGDNTEENIIPTFQVFNKEQFENELVDTKLPFNSKELYFFNISHTYNDTGLFHVQLYTFNEVSQIQVTRNVFVSEIYCENPKVEIVSPSNNLLTFHYQRKISLLSNVKVVCGGQKKVLFQWKIFKSSKWEYNNGIKSVGNNELSFVSPASKPSLNIDRRTLIAGYYIIQLVVELEGVGLDSSDEIYLNIVEDALQVTIEGGSLQQLPWKEGFTLDASNSKDPNEINQNQLSFEWYCEVVQNGNVSDCFGNGLNEVEFFGSQWFIRDKLLLEGALYTFKVVVNNLKKNRKAEASQKILLVDAEIPIVTISCQSNCRDLVNPSNRLSLVGSCKNCYTDISLSYEWNDITSEGNKAIDFLTDTLTNQNSRNLVIKAGVLDGGKEYQFSLKVTKRSGVSSYSEYSITTNRPPFGGNCTILPYFGTSLETSFNIACQNWTSLLGSVNYRMLLTNDNNKENNKLLSFGPLPTSVVLLSAGAEEDHYQVNITVEVVDLYAAFAKYYLTVKVYPLIRSTDTQNVETIQNELFNMTSGKDSKLDQLSGEGNTQGLVQFISTVTESMNLAETIESERSTSVGETETEKEEKEVKKAEMIEKRTQMRTAMVEVLTKVDVQSTDNVKQAADAIGPLLEKPDEVTPETQERALASFSRMTTFLEQDNEVKDGENPEKVTQVTSGLLKATGNLLEAVTVKKTVVVNVNATANETNKAEIDTAQRNEKKENLTRQVLSIVDKVMPLLLIGKVAGEEPTRISSDTIALELSRQNVMDFNGTGIETMNGGSFKLPGKLFDNDNDTVIDSKMSTLRQNPFAWHESSAGINSPISSLSFSSPDNKEISVENLSEDNLIEMFVPQTVQISKIRINSSWIHPDKLVAYRMNVTGQNIALLASVNSTLNNSNIKLYFRGSKRPTLEEFDGMASYKDNNERLEMFHTVPDVEAYYIGIHIVNHTKDHLPFTIELNFFTTGCLYWNTFKEIWDGKGCKVGPLTTSSKTQCLCDHLTWFGSNFFIPPNKLDIESELLKLENLDDYPALLATFCVLICAYVLSLIWARRKDRVDVRKGEPTFLRHQSVPTGTTYHIAVYTGHRGSSGTTASPTLIISGEHTDSIPLPLKNAERKLFDRGTVETFLFTSQQDLGELKYLTIWHDDAGDDPSWFLSRLSITNLANNQQYQCFCNEWLAVDQGDGLIERVLPIATQKELTAFENIFLAKTARDLTDGHLWFSIVSRPPRSNFTVMQRVSCCFCLLLSTMLSNAMFYNVAETTAAGNEIQVGGFKITWSEVIIGFQSSVIVLPLNFLLVFLFRRAMPLSLHLKETEKKEKLRLSLKAKHDLERQQDIVNNKSRKVSIEHNQNIKLTKKKISVTESIVVQNTDNQNTGNTNNQGIIDVNVNNDSQNCSQDQNNSVDQNSNISQNNVSLRNSVDQNSNISQNTVSLRNSVDQNSNISQNTVSLRNSVDQSSNINQNTVSLKDNVKKTSSNSCSQIVPNAKTAESHGLDFHYFSAQSNINMSETESSFGSVYLSAIDSINIKPSDVKKLLEDAESLNSVTEIDVVNSVKESDVKPIHSNVDSDVKPLHSSTDSAVKTLHSNTDNAVKPLHSNADSAVKPLHSNADSAVKPIHSNTDSAVKSLHSNTDSAVKPLHSNADSAVKTLHSNADSAVKPFHSNAGSAVKPLHINADSAVKPFHSNAGSAVNPLHINADSAVNPLHINADSAVKPIRSNADSVVNPLHSNADSFGKGSIVSEGVVNSVKESAIRNIHSNVADASDSIRNKESNLKQLQQLIYSSVFSLPNTSTSVHTANVGTANAHTTKVHTKKIKQIHVDMASKASFEEIIEKRIAPTPKGDFEASAMDIKNQIVAISKYMEVSTIDITSNTHFEASTMDINLPENLIYWPRWVKYIAWILCFVCSFIAAFFTLLYGLSFGKLGQEQWLFSFFISVFSDILFNQPIKVVVFAALVTLVMRKLKDDYIQCEIENFKDIPVLKSEDAILQAVDTHRPLPPTKSYIEKARKKRLYEAKMVDVVIEIVAYFVYIFFCLLIAYGHRDPDAFSMTDSIEKLFIREKFDQIRTVPDFWKWSNNVLSENLFDRLNYNGERIQHDGFIADGLTYLVGAVRLRQLRVKRGSCIASGTTGVDQSNCGRTYSFETEDKKDQFCTKWAVCRRGETALFPEYWQYKDSSSTGSYQTTGYLATYDGGGYVVHFGKTKVEIDNALSYLYNNLWIDDFTRSLFIDFTTYNTHANFYVMVTLILELPPSGGAVPGKRVLTTRLDRYSSGFAIFLGACEIFFLGFTIYYMYREFKRISIIKWKYLQDWRNWLEITCFCCIWACFGLLLIRFGLVSMTKNKYLKDRNKYVNFENAAIGDWVYTTVLSFVVLFTYLKFLKILRFNNKISLMIRTITHASHDLKYFFISFAICFMAFAQLGYLFYMQSLEEYSTFLSTVGTLFNLMLGKFNFQDIVGGKDIYGRIYFVCFIFLMTYILMNMFISILIESFGTVNEKLRDRENKYELVDFLVQRFSGFLPASMFKKKRGDEKLTKTSKQIEKVPPSNNDYETNQCSQAVDVLSKSSKNKTDVKVEENQVKPVKGDSTSAPVITIQSHVKTNVNNKSLSAPGLINQSPSLPNNKSLSAPGLRNQSPSLPNDAACHVSKHSTNQTVSTNNATNKSFVESDIISQSSSHQAVQSIVESKVSGHTRPVSISEDEVNIESKVSGHTRPVSISEDEVIIEGNVEASDVFDQPLTTNMINLALSGEIKTSNLISNTEKSENEKSKNQPMKNMEKRRSSLKSDYNKSHQDNMQKKSVSFANTKKKKKRSRSKKQKPVMELSIENPIATLELALDRLDSYVDNMLAEEEFDLKMLEIILEKQLSNRRKECNEYVECSDVQAVGDGAVNEVLDMDNIQTDNNVIHESANEDDMESIVDGSTVDTTQQIEDNVDNNNNQLDIQQTEGNGQEVAGINATQVRYSSLDNIIDVTSTQDGDDIVAGVTSSILELDE